MGLGGVARAEGVHEEGQVGREKSVALEGQLGEHGNDGELRGDEWLTARLKRLGYRHAGQRGHACDAGVEAEGEGTCAMRAWRVRVSVEAEGERGG